MMAQTVLVSRGFWHMGLAAAVVFVGQHDQTLGPFLIDKLELLLALAKERHFGRAAEACGVTQPTMSTSLKQLEEILGVMLVQRGSRFQGFTPEGERTLDWARRIVGDTRAMRQEIKSLKDKLSGEIRIAAIPTVLGMVAQLTTPFRARHPDVRFQIRSCTSAEVLGLLENIEVDASHVGLGVNPAALYAVADRLAQPDGAWKPFDRSGFRQLFYRDPERADCLPRSRLV